MDEPIIFFSHIPKTAGSTLRKIIDAQYSPEQILSLYDLSIPESIARVREMNDEVRIITAHRNFALRGHITKPFRSITVLRDPIETVISLYYYIARVPTHQYHPAIASGQMRIPDVARLVQHRQTLWLSGEEKDTQLPLAELLARAKQNLVSETVEFGLTERFDEALVLFSRALNWNVRSYMPQNVTANRPTLEQVAPADLAEVEDASALDMELYSFARERFQERIAQQPPEFAAEVARLRRRSGTKRLLHAFASRLGFWRS